jgi:hypothetical protein
MVAGLEGTLRGAGYGPMYGAFPHKWVFQLSLVRDGHDSAWVAV